jgi:hypothetical protein
MQKILSNLQKVSGTNNLAKSQVQGTKYSKLNCIYIVAQKTSIVIFNFARRS